MLRAMILFATVALTVRAPDTLAPSVTPVESAAPSASTDPAPLLVVLHGNGETAEQRAAKWQEAAARRGWKLLALDCPRDLGCNEDGQWYAWNGSSRWIFERVRELAARERIDASRIYLAGWSGGATYIGKRMAEWPRVFAAVVIHGGGSPPRERTCPSRPFPAYFLVGDQNPAHEGAVRLRTYLEHCEQRVRWDLVPGANHAREDEALTPAKAEAILLWLASQRRVDAWS
jgi:poly(3-hydroxybutyrate) depolymerase